MKRVLEQTSIKSIGLLLILFLALAQSSLATTVIVPSDDDMVIGARAILRGKVVAIESSFDERSSHVYTYITVKVREVLKGQISERKIVLKELGGQVGDRMSLIYGSPQFKKGEKVLLYLDTWADGSLRTHQMFLGKFNIVKDPGTGREIAVRSSPDENTTVLKRQFHGHGAPGPSTERLELSRYLRMVRNRLAVTWERSLQFEAEAYANVPLLAEPAEYGSIAGKGDIRANFTFLGPFRFFEPDTGQPVSVLLNPNPSEDQGVPQVVLNSADVVAAGNAWTNVSGSSLQMSYGGTMEQCYALGSTPGVHVVSNNCDGQNGPSSGCAGILARGGVRLTGPLTRNINGTTFRQTIQGFVSMNPWAACSFTINCNVQEILTHEIGHAIGLSHSQFSDATMAAFAHFDGRCASIRTDDADGIRAIYPGSGGGPGPLTITTSSLASGTVGSPYSQTVIASGGTPPYGWSLVAGLGTLPTGLGLSAGGAITGTPGAVGTYNFTVRVTDNAGGSAQKALSIVIGGGGASLNSQFVSQTVPTSVQPDQVFSVNMRFLNTGTQTWSGSAYFIASQNPALNQTWGGNGVPLSAFVAGPGELLNVDFNARAPSAPGIYNFQWQMYQNFGAGFFGQMSTNVAIQVGSVATDGAAFVSQTVPNAMIAGRTYGVSVTMANAGTTTWAAGNYYLGSMNPQGNTTWGLNLVNLSAPVAPGAQAVVSFNITAPAAPGNHNFQWRMARDGSGYFGSMSTNVVVAVAAKATYFDFSGDGKSDISVYRNQTGQWLILNSSTSQGTVQNWGFPSMQDQPVPGDYDGDGRADLAVYRGLTGQWLTLKSSTGQVTVQSWGYPSLGDLPVPADYDGDGKTDLAVYRSSTGQWLILNSSTGQGTVQTWGFPSMQDQPVSGDYDGDGRADFAVYRGLTGQWLILNSSTGQSLVQSWGFPSMQDKPVPGDYDGDGRTDLTVYRGLTGQWLILKSSTGQSTVQGWGYPSLGDMPIPADYDGDGKTDIAVYRGSTGQWLVLNSATGQGSVQSWGFPSLGDIPLPSVYVE